MKEWEGLPYEVVAELAHREGALYFAGTTRGEALEKYRAYAQSKGRLLDMATIEYLFRDPIFLEDDFEGAAVTDSQGELLTKVKSHAAFGEWWLEQGAPMDIAIHTDFADGSRFSVALREIITD